MPRKRGQLPEDYSKPFPTRLREIMDKKNKTQQDVADAIEKTRQAVGYYVDGSSSPDWKTIVTLAQYLEVSTDWLLGISEYASKDNETIAASDLGLSERAITALKDLVFEPSMRDIVMPVLNRLVCMEEFERLLLGLRGLRKASEHSLSNPEPAIMTPRWKLAQKDRDMAVKVLNQHEQGMYQVISSSSYLDVLRFHLEDTFRDLVREYVYDYKECLENLQKIAQEK